MKKLIITTALAVLLLSAYAQKGAVPMPAFEQVPPVQSGVSFQNTVKANVATKENLFDYDFFYNGSGVAVGDFNNDGLPDLFFTANQEKNRLYLNQGDLRFTDITESAEVNTAKKWASGVSLVDINNDGWLDIYVSQGGPFPAEERRNLLFINQKDNTFSEQAEEYGLADTGISTQAAFFDYDQDGDLDCVVSNENRLYGVDPVNFYNLLNQRPALKAESSSHLYRNDNGQFVDVTAEAGLLSPTFGLGLTLSDINNDGWVDIYVANDYYVPDAMYINQKNGTFRNEIKARTRQISFYGMGVDIADINNDGSQDIYVLDMASNDHFRSKTLMASMNVSNFRLLVEDLEMPHQYMFNSLQLNRGNDYFDNVAHLCKMAKTDWSWAGLMADFNNDGLKDVFVTNGYRRYALDNDLKNRVLAAQQQYQGNVPLEVKEELYYSMPSEKLPNVFYLNKGNLKFEDVADQAGLEMPTFSNGATFADLDLDGDLDIVINNMDDPALIYKNLAVDQKLGNFLRVNIRGDQSETFAKVKIFYDGQQQMVETKRVRGYLSAVEDIAHFGLGNYKRIDSLVVYWPDGRKTRRRRVKANQILEIGPEKAQPETYAKAEAKPMFPQVSVGQLKLFFKHRENNYDDFAREILLPYKQSTFGPCVEKGDVNGDGKEDLFVGGAFNQPGALFIQTENAFQRLVPPAMLEDSLYEDQAALFFDYDGDGDQDLLVGSGGNSTPEDALLYQNRLYRNDGDTWTDRSQDLGYRSNANTGDFTALDYDQDGDLDLLVANRIMPQAYPTAAESYLLENTGGKFQKAPREVIPEIEDFGIINAALSTDFNGDGWMDLILLGEWTSAGFFENRQGKFRRLNDQTMLSKKGWWFSATETDVNKDGWKDYVLGNLGLNSKYSASPDHPLRVYANDFDQSGTLDIVLSKDYNGKEVPVRGRECSSQQMPFIKEKFPTFKEFAQASLDEIYGEEIEESIFYEANDFRSYVLINQKGKGFDWQPLPVEAQMFPLLNVVPTDLNGDGYEDLILSGTIYETEVETPRWDAGGGLVLLSDTRLGYQTMQGSRKKLRIQGDVKAMVELRHQGRQASYLISGLNNALLSIREINR